MGFLLGAIKIIFVLGFLIFIHEGGHFLVAKACKVSVREFSIGFGPKIFSKTKNGTKYILRAIPLGGFVDMLGENERKDVEGSFSNSKLSKRIAIVCAGAIVNIVFGIVVYFSWIAIDFNQVSMIINNIYPEYSENISELKADDQILSINGKNIHLKSDLDRVLDDVKNEELNIVVLRDGEKINLSAKTTEITTKFVGIYYTNSENNYTSVQYVQENSPADKAGIKKGDIIKKINGVEITDSSKISDNINSNDIAFTIIRDEKIMDITVESEDVNKYILGIDLKPADATLKNRLYYGFWQTLNYLSEVGNNIKNLFTGNVNVNQMMGPIGISEAIVKTKGFSQYIYFLSVISLSLGITNLLPIPALDGGRLVLLILEGIRRKPLNEELEIKIQMLGFSFLIALSILIAFNDIIRIF